MARTMGAAIFLLGAGASRDAGMPLVQQVTKELRDRLPAHHGPNGPQPEFPDLFDRLADYDPVVRDDYERFFEWLDYLSKGLREGFREAVAFKLEHRLVDAVPFLRFGIGAVVKDILSSRHNDSQYQPGYFAKLGDFLPEHGRLKVFTTNYDLCVEDGCRAQGIDVVTGFKHPPDIGRWTPSLFQKSGPGINLYKLHSSLNWRPVGDLERHWPIEYYPPQWNRAPELILGPGSKLQHDEPFVTLYAEFHKAVRGAKVCVAIGCSWRDPHISAPLTDASRRRKLRIVDVNPSSTNSPGGALAIRKGAKDAFESGAIQTEVMKSLTGS